MSRELDALVAEKVMGYIVRDGFVSWADEWTLPAPYSSDIAAAWQVSEKVGDLGLYRFMLTRRLNGTEGWEASWSRWGPDGPTDERGWAHAPTPATAICLAALEALGVPIPETP